jgi:hypothetical protein
MESGYPGLNCSRLLVFLLFVEDLLSRRKAVCSVSSSPLIFSAGLGIGKDERLFIVVMSVSWKIHGLRLQHWIDCVCRPSEGKNLHSVIESVG